MSAIQTISKRRSSPKLIAPAPCEQVLRLIVDAGLCAPDHGRLKPWQILLIEGDARNKLGELYLQAALAETPDLSEERQQRIANMPLRAPVVLVVAAKTIEGHKVPVLEQLIATGAAVQNMLLAAQELGVGAMWRTGEMAYKASVKTGLGLDGSDEIIGYIYLGTPVLTAKPRETVDRDLYYRAWSGSE